MLKKFSNPIFVKSLLNLTTFVNLSTKDPIKSQSTVNRHQTDVLIAGGGVIGCSTAYWLKQHNKNINVTVIERDTSYSSCSTVLSVGGVRQQFSEIENIQMSLFCSHVLKNMNKYFSLGDGEDLDVQFIERGYLLLSSENGRHILQDNFQKQIEMGAQVQLLTANQIKERFGWLNTDNVDCGVIGTSNEGWFDPWLLLNHVRRKAKQLGVNFLHGDVVGLEGSTGKIRGATVQLFSPKTKELETTQKPELIQFSCDWLVNATGAWAERLSEYAEKACGLSGFDYPLGVRACKRYVFNFACRDINVPHTPMIVDYSGVYCRKESGGDFICGLSPPAFEEPDAATLSVDYDWFENTIWPLLYERIPAMEAVKVKSAWAGYYDYNIRDQNLIIGPHPTIEGFMLCNGSSGHGIQHALAIGRANAEWILHGRFVTIDLSRMSYNRYLEGGVGLVVENNVI